MSSLRSKRNFTQRLTSSRAKIQPINDITNRKKDIDTIMSKIAAHNIAIQQLEKHKQDFNKKFRDSHRHTLTNKYKLSPREKAESLVNQDFVELDDEQIQGIQSNTATEFREFTKNHTQLINNLKHEREELKNQINRLRQGIGGTKKRIKKGTKKRHKHKKH
jgi:ppGpp synthetase/RelA/SpoT-type nucleotidyltranferase